MDAKTRIEAIRERAERATKGPWTTCDGEERATFAVDGGDGGGAVCDRIDFESDAAFIAASREDVPWLIEQLELRTAAGDRLAQEVQRLDHANGDLRLLVERKNAILREIADDKAFATDWFAVKLREALEDE